MDQFDPNLPGRFLVHSDAHHAAEGSRRGRRRPEGHRRSAEENRDRPVDSRVEPAAEFEYRATLAARPYGQVTTADPAWTTLAESAGHGHPPHRLPLRFEAVDCLRESSA
jgi:hypothetical protein